MAYSQLTVYTPAEIKFLKNTFQYVIDHMKQKKIEIERKKRKKSFCGFVPNENENEMCIVSCSV